MYGLYGYSENESVATLALLLCNLLEVAVDDSYCEHDTGAGANGSHEVREYAKGSDADATEGGSSVNVAAEVSDHGFLSDSFDRHVLVKQVADNVTWSLSRDIDPYAREECAGAHDETAVEESMYWVTLQIEEVTRWGDVISETANWCRVSGHVEVLPLSDEADEEVSFEFAVKYL